MRVELSAKRLLKWMAAGLACLQLSIGVARGAESGFPLAAGRVATGSDVALSRHSELTGQVVDASGVAVAHTEVTAVQAGRAIASTRTDENGWFALDGMKGGVYSLETENATNLVRAWTPISAPPSASEHALLVDGQQVARGQGAMRRILTSPWTWGIGIGAAVAVPLIIVATDDDDKPKGS